MLLLYILAFVVLINCAYYYLYSRFSFNKTKESKTDTSFPVSILVCAKNESVNLKKHIPLWLTQDYPNFELVLINDTSTDDSLEIMQDFETKDPRVKVVDVIGNEAFWGSKKYALTLGIKKALNKRMLFTDADCYPAGPHWIREMASHFSKEKQLVLGYGGYERAFGILNAIIRLETVLTAIQYFSLAKSGVPYMGVGRNLGYTSNLYYENNGFMSHMDIPSGDDDLFVQEVATDSNVAFVTSPISFTYSIPKNTLGEWFQQKKRHISTAKHYKSNFKVLLAANYIFNILFWIFGILSLIFSDWKIAVAIIGLRFLVQMVVIGMGAKKLKETDLIFFLPMLELFLVCLQLSIFISGSLSKNRHWK